MKIPEFSFTIFKLNDVWMSGLKLDKSYARGITSNEAASFAIMAKVGLEPDHKFYDGYGNAIFVYEDTQDEDEIYLVKYEGKVEFE